MVMVRAHGQVPWLRLGYMFGNMYREDRILVRVRVRL